MGSDLDVTESKNITFLPVPFVHLSILYGVDDEVQSPEE